MPAQPIVEIPLTRGLVALIDVADHDLVAPYPWCASALSGHTRYACTTVSLGRRSQKLSLRMHRLIVGLTSDDPRVADHINGNGLDNRRCNLRVCKRAENLRNRRLNSNNRSGLKGVRGHLAAFQARISIDKKTIHLGTYRTAEDAARAYDEAALRLHGPFARLNFPDPNHSGLPSFAAHKAAKDDACLGQRLPGI